MDASYILERMTEALAAQKEACVKVIPVETIIKDIIFQCHQEISLEEAQRVGGMTNKKRMAAINAFYVETEKELRNSNRKYIGRFHYTDDHGNKFDCLTDAFILVAVPEGGLSHIPECEGIDLKKIIDPSMDGYVQYSSSDLDFASIRTTMKEFHIRDKKKSAGEQIQFVMFNDTAFNAKLFMKMSEMFGYDYEIWVDNTSHVRPAKIKSKHGFGILVPMRVYSNGYAQKGSVFSINCTEVAE